MVTTMNALNVLVGGLKPSDADIDIVIGIEEVNTEQDVSYWIANISGFQRQCVIFLHGQQLQGKYDCYRALWNAYWSDHKKLQERAYHSSSSEFISVASMAGGADIIVGTMSTLLHLLSISVKSQ